MQTSEELESTVMLEKIGSTSRIYDNFASPKKSSVEDVDANGDEDMSVCTEYERERDI